MLGPLKLVCKWVVRMQVHPGKCMHVYVRACMRACVADLFMCVCVCAGVCHLGDPGQGVSVASSDNTHCLLQGAQKTSRLCAAPTHDIKEMTQCDSNTCSPGWGTLVTMALWARHMPPYHGGGGGVERRGGGCQDVRLSPRTTCRSVLGLNKNSWCYTTNTRGSGYLYRFVDLGTSKKAAEWGEGEEEGGFFVAWLTRGSRIKACRLESHREKTNQSFRWVCCRSQTPWLSLSAFRFSSVTTMFSLRYLQMWSVHVCIQTEGKILPPRSYPTSCKSPIYFCSFRHLKIISTHLYILLCFYAGI